MKGSERMVFKEIEKHDLPDIQSAGYLYEHEETGAQVLYLKNDDPNKAFTIGFKTPPYNDNGITHILEHSVLNGSKKYPSKYKISSVMALKMPPLTTFGCVKTLKCFANFLAIFPPSPANPPISAPIPVGIEIAIVSLWFIGFFLHLKLK